MSYWTSDTFTLHDFIEEHADDSSEVLHILCSHIDPFDESAREIRIGFTLLMLLKIESNMHGVPRDIYQAAKTALDNEDYDSEDLMIMYNYIQ